MAKSIAFNGINGATGEYLLQASAADLVKRTLGEHVDEVERKRGTARLESAEPTFSAIAGVDTSDLSQAGWGLIFPAKSDDKSLRRVLADLIEHREKAASAIDKKRFVILSGADGYRPGERARDFLMRHGADPFGPVDPDILPFYLLLVGNADEIPFEFQYQLDINHAVGRIWFESDADYSTYARHVIASEDGRTLPRTAAFFGVRNPADDATKLSSSDLVQPLASKLGSLLPSWNEGMSDVIGEVATKEALKALLAGEAAPTFLFSASHGMGFPKGHALQKTDQGALLCQDWPGPVAWKKEIPKDFYLGASDLVESNAPAGRIVFNFACYGAGTPAANDYQHLKLNEPVELSERAFVAAMPRALLTGGAVAVIAHVERAWGYSFRWEGNPQLATFSSTIQSLFEGVPIGAAFDYFNLRHLYMANAWSEEVKAIEEFNAQVVPASLARIWTAQQDARSYVILGDPAARLNVATA